MTHFLFKKNLIHFFGNVQSYNAHQLAIQSTQTFARHPMKNLTLSILRKFQNNFDFVDLIVQNFITSVKFGLDRFVLKFQYYSIK